MKNPPFIWKQQLLGRLTSPFVGMSVQVDVLKRPYTCKIWYSHGSEIEIYCRMFDIAPRIEVGVLEFSEVSERTADDLDLGVPKAFSDSLTIEKLTIIEQGFSVDSGLALANRHHGEEILIIASVQPCGLAVQTPWGGAADFFRSPYFFSPAYDLDQYRRSPIT